MRRQCSPEHYCYYDFRGTRYSTWIHYQTRLGRRRGKGRERYARIVAWQLQDARTRTYKEDAKIEEREDSGRGDREKRRERTVRDIVNTQLLVLLCVNIQGVPNLPYLFKELQQRLLREFSLSKNLQKFQYVNAISFSTLISQSSRKCCFVY